MDPGDLRIIKVIIFSRAIAAAVHFFGKATNLYTPVEDGSDTRRFTFESALALSASTFCCYAFVYEIGAMPASFVNSFNRGANLNASE